MRCYSWHAPCASHEFFLGRVLHLWTTVYSSILPYSSCGDAAAQHSVCYILRGRFSLRPPQGRRTSSLSPGQACAWLSGLLGSVLAISVAEVHMDWWRQFQPRKGGQDSVDAATAKLSSFLGMILSVPPSSNPILLPCLPPSELLYLRWWASHVHHCANPDACSSCQAMFSSAVPFATAGKRVMPPECSGSTTPHLFCLAACSFRFSPSLWCTSFEFYLWQNQQFSLSSSPNSDFFSVAGNLPETIGWTAGKQLLVCLVAASWLLANPGYHKRVLARIYQFRLALCMLGWNSVFLIDWTIWGPLPKWQ